MRLELHWSQVETLTVGTTTRLVGKALHVNLDELQAQLEADARLQRVRLDLTAPGDSCRIGRVVDVLAPWAKGDGGEDFPGYLANSRAPAAVGRVP
jgi:Glycine/sarcosine/betaine reductase component B subunits